MFCVLDIIFTIKYKRPIQGPFYQNIVKVSYFKGPEYLVGCIYVRVIDTDTDQQIYVNIHGWMNDTFRFLNICLNIYSYLNHSMWFIMSVLNQSSVHILMREWCSLTRFTWSLPFLDMIFLLIISPYLFQWQDYSQLSC